MISFDRTKDCNLKRHGKAEYDHRSDKSTESIPRFLQHLDDNEAFSESLWSLDRDVVNKRDTHGELQDNRDGSSHRRERAEDDGWENVASRISTPASNMKFDCLK